MRCFISSFHTKSETQRVSYTFSTSQFKLAMFQVVHSHKWTMFNISDRESCKDSHVKVMREKEL